jgi:signal transduction histidine kinase
MNKAVNTLLKSKSLVTDTLSLQEVLSIALELASGNYTARGQVFGNNEYSDSLMVTLNLLGEELRESVVSKEYIHSILKGFTDLMFVMDNDNTITQVNEACLVYLKLADEGEILFKKINKFIGSQNTFETIDDILMVNKTVINFETDLVTSNGTKIPSLISCAYILNNAKEPVGKLVIAKDVTDLRNKELALIKKNQELNTFIYKASHDLKGPLTSFKGLLSLAKNDVKENPESYEMYLPLLEETALKLDGVLNDLLDLGRITQNKLLKQNINFEQLIDDVLFHFQHYPEWEKLNIITNIEKVDGVVSDKMAVSSIIQNLIDNAYKYRSQQDLKPYIHISLKKEEDYALLTIADNGIGISTDVLPKIFDMFYRGTSKSSGSGLGMYLVKSAIDKINGTIEVHSEPREGTIVKIKFPCSISTIS